MLRLPEGEPHPWILVAAGFDDLGGTSRANLALAKWLAGRGNRVDLVGHHFDPSLAEDARFNLHRVAAPLGSLLIGEHLLSARCHALARRAAREPRPPRVVVNGSNCPWPGVNWVHAVHHAWPCSDSGAPLWFRTWNRLLKTHHRWRESLAFRQARLLIANSGATRRELLRHFDLQPDRIETVYLGADPAQRPATPEERRAARRSLGLAEDRALAVHVGAVGLDRNKGLDTLLAAWSRLIRGFAPSPQLAVAGHGPALTHWQRWAADLGLNGQVHFLGFCREMSTLLAAADLIVSPARYEAFGLSVHEALARGVPAIVSAGAGIAELLPPELEDMLLRDPESVEELITRLRSWAADPEGWRRSVAAFSSALRDRSWDDMAREMVEAIEERAEADQ